MVDSNLLPTISWCSRCLYPSSSAVPLVFDEAGVCSGCRVHDQKSEINWSDRLDMLLDDLDGYRRSSGYECVIGVSGGKDSYYQVHFVKEVLGLNPLLVTYNGNNYLDVGWQNLHNMKKVFGVDHLIISPSVDMLVRMNRLGFIKTGDMNWHAHCGIFTQPMKVAAQQNIPLVFWGEHGWTDLGGMLSMYDFPEFTYRYRKDQGLRGFDWQDFVNDPDESISENELEIFKYPSDELVSSVGLRGLFIGNFDPWDSEKHTKLVEEKYGWQRSPTPFERTYRLTSNLDDMYENGAHDYLKFIKFGYGRATDHASKDIRAGRLSREEGIRLVRKHDHVEPSDLQHWLEYVDRDHDWFWDIANKFRSPAVWSSINGFWVKQNIWDNL